MPRFFVEQEPAGEYFVGGENGLHMVRSLRMRPGEAAVLCAGTGKDFLCTLLECREDGALVRVDRVVDSQGEPKTRVTVCQCFPKGDKLDTVVQKSVELGAVEILPVESARCISRPDGKSMEKKRARLQKVALEAAQQSGRGIVPEINKMVDFKKAVSECEANLIILFYEGGGQSIKSLINQDIKSVAIFIGPEGGFDKEEVEAVLKKGGIKATLGKRILRTQTAPVAALASIMLLTNNME